MTVDFICRNALSGDFPSSTNNPATGETAGEPV